MKQVRTRFFAQDQSSITTLTTRVYQQLRDEIIGCRLKPSEKLRLVGLQQRLGAGMSAIREALSRLTAEGLVRAEDQRGFRVSPASLEDLADLTRVRIELEQLALRQSIAKGDIQWEANPLAAYHHMAKSAPSARGTSDRNDPGAQRHRAFHEALVAGCGSPWLEHFRQIVWAEAERYRRLALLPVVRNRGLAAEHKELLDSALKHDAERACQAIEEHFLLTANLAKPAKSRPTAAAARARAARPKARRPARRK